MSFLRSRHRLAPAVLAFSLLIPGVFLDRTPAPGSDAIIWQVTPQGDPMSVSSPTSGLTAVFTVTNSAATAKNATFSCATTGPASCTSLSLPGWSFDAGESVNVTATFSTSGGGTGTIEMTASGGGSGPGTGYYDLTISGSPPPSGAAPTISFRNQNGDNVDRSLCLTSGAGPESAYQCGDLMVSRSTASYATMGKERAVTLFYHSGQAYPQPVVAVAVTQPNGQPAPTNIYAELRVDNGAGYVVRSSANWSGWDATSIPTRQIGLLYRDSTSPSGIYPFQFSVENQYPGGNHAVVDSGFIMFVSRYNSQLGRGWSVAGVENLVFNQPVGRSNGDIMWIGGEGSAKRYYKLNSTTWVAPAGAFRDTLVYNAGTSTYTRTLRHGVQVVFDASGRHIQTVARTLQRSNFYWTSNQLDSIKVPPNGASNRTYKFTYSAGKLDYITDPAARVTDVTVGAATNWLTVFSDGDTWYSQYFYDNQGRMTRLDARNSRVTTFTYAAGNRLMRSIALNPGGNSGDTTNFESWDTKGVSGAAAVDTAQVFTVVRGPRPNVADDATFWIDRWGAPTKIINPLGQMTRLFRGDPAVPALVTRVDKADSSVGLMSYDNRGNLTQTRDSSYALTNPVQTAVRKWFYTSPNTKDAPDSTIDPENVKTVFQYNSLGLLSQATAPNGHVTSYTYVAQGSADSLSGLLRSVTEQNVSVWDTASLTEVTGVNLVTKLGFNTLGNVVSDTSPMGRVRSFVRNSYQQVQTTYDGAGYRRDFVYDVLNRMTKDIVHRELAGTTNATLYPADSGISTPDTTIYTYTRDNLTQVRDPRGVIRSYGYRYSDRITETDDYGNIDSTWYNASGLIDARRLRTGQVIRNSYDVAGRLLWTTWPARDSSPMDTVKYQFDFANRITGITSKNGQSIVRTYYANGLMRSEHQLTAATIRHTYGYDRSGRRTWYIIGEVGNSTYNDSISYAYNTAGDLSWIRARWRTQGADINHSDSVRLAWDELGRRDSVIFPAIGVTQYFAYEKDGGLQLLCSVNPAVNPSVFRLSMYNKVIDANQRVKVRATLSSAGTSCTGPNPVEMETNTYSATGAILRQAQNVTLSPRTSYRYDGSGNQTYRHYYDGSNYYYAYVIPATHNRVTTETNNVGGSTRYTYTYNDDGGRNQECPSGSCSTSTFGYRIYKYDGTGRVAGTLEKGCSTFDMSFGVCINPSPTWQYVPCKYDPVGRMYSPCENGSPLLGFDGSKVTRTDTDNHSFGWSFVHGPGTDDPLLGYQPQNKIHAYFITDGQGRQYAVGNRAAGNLIGTSNNDQNQYAFQGGKFGSGIRNSTTFGALKNESKSQPQLSFFRNRFYDQRTGRWTQEDPIGLAGGLNLYQYSGNNPAMFTDPFGLKVVFGSDRAREMYDQLRQNATNAAKSKNKSVAKAGRELSKKLDALEADEETVEINVGEGRDGFGKFTGTSRWGININPSSPSGYSPQVKLAHELGHAYSAMVDGLDPSKRAVHGISNAMALEVENSQRSIWGCSARVVHDGIFERFNPRCE